MLHRDFLDLFSKGPGNFLPPITPVTCHNELWPLRSPKMMFAIKSVLMLALTDASGLAFLQVYFI